MLADDCDFGGTRAKRGVFLSYRQARTLRVTLTLSLTLTLAPTTPLINQLIINRQHLAEGRLEHLAAMNFSSLPPPLDRWGCLARYAHV